MNRMSSLPTAQFCGLSSKLSERYGSGTPARLSSAFHAHCAGNDALLAGLTAKERQEVSQWQKPADVVMGPVTLRYQDAEKELEVCLDAFGQSCAREDAITVGHLDFAWCQMAFPAGFEEDGIPLTAYVADIKKSRWTSVDGADSLQLHAYGTAYARRREANAYTTGIWLPVDGEWLWSKRLITLDSPEHQQILAEILHAATNDSATGSVGAHCQNCYGRLHCPEYLLPAALGTTVFSPVVEGMAPTSAEALKLLRMIQVLDGENGLLEKAKDQLKELVRRGEIEIVDGGKRWVPSEMPGRKSLDKEKLAQEVGDLKRFERQGKPYEQFTWQKVR